MAIEQIMYFILGFLAASLLAVIVIPSVWKRAVRLTKKRMEMATPITMTEFRAEKDQMRAEFALNTRKLERTIENLHSRVTEQLSALNTAQTDMAIAKAERNRALAVQAELEQRLDVANDRVRELEREAADLSQRLRGRTREIEELAALAQPSDEAKPSGSTTAINVIRRALSLGERDTLDALEGIDEAYSRISGAGTSLEALLDNQDPEKPVEADAPLALRLSEEDALNELREKIANVENAITIGIGSEDARDKARAQFDDIAAAVTGIVYDNESAEDPDESLFERIRRFAGDHLDDNENKAADPVSARMPAKRDPSEPSLSDRLASFANFNN